MSALSRSGGTPDPRGILVSLSKHEDCNRSISGVCPRQAEIYVFVCHLRRISHWLTILACKLSAVIFLELPATWSRPASSTTEAGRDRDGDPRRDLGVAFFLRNIGVARSNIGRTTIVLMKDMWMLPTRSANMPAVCVRVLPGNTRCMNALLHKAPDLMLSYISTPIVTGRHAHDTCEHVVQQATKSDRSVTRQGCQTVRPVNIAISAALNALYIQQYTCFADDDLDHSEFARHCERHNRFVRPRHWLAAWSWSGTGDRSTTRTYRLQSLLCSVRRATSPSLELVCQLGDWRTLNPRRELVSDPVYRHRASVAAARHDNPRFRQAANISKSPLSGSRANSQGLLAHCPMCLHGIYRGSTYPQGSS